MPANEQADFLLGPDGGPKPFMLVRPGRSGAARAWRRDGVPYIPGGGRAGEGRYSSTAPQLRFAETFDDFSGGFGYAYRGQQTPDNAIHWSENLDTRFAGQAVHCQAVLKATLPDAGTGGEDGGPAWVFDLPLVDPTPPVGFGAVLVQARQPFAAPATTHDAQRGPARQQAPEPAALHTG